MYFTKYAAIVAFIATGALAAPGNQPPPKPSPSTPSKPATPTATVVSQSNSCGNNASPYCCNTDNKGKYTTCKTLAGSDTCSATTVCCNADNSVQVCLGDATIL